MRRLKAELKRVTEERDILRKRRRTSLASATAVRLYCQASVDLQHHAYVPSASFAPQQLYAWKAQPLSQRAIDDKCLLGLLKHAWLESGGVYGYRKLTLDMRDMGESCSRHRVARLLRSEGIKAQRGYGKRPRVKGGAPAVVAPNLLSQQFSVDAPNKAWVTDITYISTHEGWLYLATVIDLFSRQVIGWSTGSRIDTQLPLDALHMAIWRRRPRETVIVHSDQGWYNHERPNMALGGITPKQRLAMAA